MARNRIRVKGLQETARKIEALARAGGDEVRSGLRVIGETIMTDVRASRPGAGVPKDTGNLAASGRVTGPDRRGAVRLSFGGAAAPYALRQHEELTYRHTLGEARYLVRGLERWMRGGTPEQAIDAMLDAAVDAAKRTR
jgi:hypothetical protein